MNEDDAERLGDNLLATHSAGAIPGMFLCGAEVGKLVAQGSHPTCNACLDHEDAMECCMDDAFEAETGGKPRSFACGREECPACDGMKLEELLSDADLRSMFDVLDRARAIEDLAFASEVFLSRLREIARAMPPGLTHGASRAVTALDKLVAARHAARREQSRAAPPLPPAEGGAP